MNKPYRFKNNYISTNGLFFSAFAFCLVSSCGAGGAGPTSGTSRGRITPSEHGLSVVEAVGNTWVASGGQYSASIGSVDVFNTISKTMQRTSLSIPRNSMASAVIGTKVYFAGGVNVAGESNVIDIYDTSNGTWSSDTLSVARSAYRAGASIGNKLLVSGGYNRNNLINPIATGGTNSLNTLEVIDVSNATKQLVNLSEPRSGAAMAVVGTKAYILGGYPCFYGYVAACDASNTMDIYDSAGGTVSTVSMPRRRGDGSASVLGTKIYVAGGGDRSGNSAQMDIYDTVANTWSSVAVTSRTEVSVFASGNLVIIAGGIIGATTGGTTVIEVYDVTTGLVRTKQMQYPRYKLAGTAVNGYAYFIGGLSSSAVYDDFEFYQLSAL